MKTLSMLNVQEMNIHEMRTQNGGCDESYLEDMNNFYYLWKAMFGDGKEAEEIKEEISACRKQL